MRPRIDHGWIVVGSAALLAALILVLLSPARAEEYDRSSSFVPSATSSTTEPRYDRSRYSWGDSDGDCQDARHEAFIRSVDRLDEHYELSEDGCKVVSGAWVSDYSGHRYEGPVYDAEARVARMHAEHVYAFHHAWETGLKNQPYERQLQFYNDPRNLIALYGPENSSKGDKGPCDWRPPHAGAWCEYGLTFLRMATTYGLEPSRCDLEAALTMMSTCEPEWDLLQ